MNIHIYINTRIYDITINIGLVSTVGCCLLAQEAQKEKKQIYAFLKQESPEIKKKAFFYKNSKSDLITRILLSIGVFGLLEQRYIYMCMYMYIFMFIY
jgi:hypothetical protein